MKRHRGEGHQDGFHPLVNADQPRLFEPVRELTRRARQQRVRRDEQRPGQRRQSRSTDI